VRRLLPLLLAAALASAAVASAASCSPQRYSVAQVVRAFRSAGISLRPQRVGASARYVRLAARSSLRVVVYPGSRAAGAIEVDVGGKPTKSRPAHDAVVIRLGAPHGSPEPTLQQTELANVALVYWRSRSGCLDAAVRAALHELRRS